MLSNLKKGFTYYFGVVERESVAREKKDTELAFRMYKIWVNNDNTDSSIAADGFYFANKLICHANCTKINSEWNVAMLSRCIKALLTKNYLYTVE